MSKNKFLSFALAGGLAATGAHAVENQPAGSDAETDIIAGAADDALIFSGPSDDFELIEDLLLGPIIELDEEAAGEVEFDLAQTVYGGGAGDNLRVTPSRGNITLDNGIKKPKGITLDNGIKKGNRLKPAGTGRKLRGGSKRKRRN